MSGAQTTAGTIKSRETYSGWLVLQKKENCMVGTSKMRFLTPHWLATKSYSPVHYLQSIHAGLSREAPQLTLKPCGWPAEQLSDPTCTLWHRPLIWRMCPIYPQEWNWKMWSPNSYHRLSSFIPTNTRPSTKWTLAVKRSLCIFF